MIWFVSTTPAEYFNQEQIEDCHFYSNNSSRKWPSTTQTPTKDRRWESDSPMHDFLLPGLKSNGALEALTQTIILSLMLLHYYILCFRKPTRTFPNFIQGNWDGFTSLTEKALAHCFLAGHRLLDAVVGMVKEIIQSASMRYFPASFVQKQEKEEKEAKLLLPQRCNLFSYLTAQDIAKRIDDFSDEIKSRLLDETQLRWTNVSEAINFRTTPSKFRESSVPYTTLPQSERL